MVLARKPPRSKHPRQPSHGWGNRWKILIIGATGGTGRQLVQQALDLGHQVTALVRNPAKLETQHPNLRVIKGNVLDYAAVKSAMQGQNAVLSALGHKRWFYPNKILSEGTRNILRAMKECNVPRFVCESSLGLGNSVGRLGLLFTFLVVPLILPFVFWDKVRQEKLIEESEVDWVIVRPGVLKNSPARGKYRHGHNLGNFIWTVRISRADVADFMLKQLTDDNYVGTAVGVAW
ncbi:MAG: SDR family oxidoreductase [Verrucomicrobiota bacterium]|nr:SDR family oxidoreductase [Verrucomicrobiota bacterium]